MVHARGLALVSAIVFAQAGITKAINCTLSDAAIMSLDYDQYHYYVPPFTPYITDRRNVPGPGVEFDIYYPGNDSPDDHLFWTSDELHGAGTLAGIDITAYENFDLKFTLLSANGSQVSGGPMLVGAYINGWHHPEAVDLDPASNHPDFAVSSMPLSLLDNDQDIDRCGFHTWLWIPEYWSPDGNTVTLLVEPAPGAVSIPEPATGLLLLTAGTLVLRRRRPALQAQL